MTARDDIRAVRLDPTQGHERRGRGPVPVVADTAFDGVARVPVVLITAGGGFAASLGRAGLKAAGVARCDQPRARDLSARDARHAESVPDAVTDEVPARVVATFE